MSTKTANIQIDESCFAAKVRLVSRVVTGVYDDALRDLGVKASQLNILALTARMGIGRPAEVCEMLQLDTSTLSRNVERLRSSGWLETVDEPGRAQPFQLTDAGRDLLKQAEPAWKQAQKKARRILGKELAEALSKPMSELCPVPSKG